MEKTELLNNARILWNYMVLHQPITPADLILVLGSHDTNVAICAADLFKSNIAYYILASGGKGKLTDKKFSLSEAETFSNIMEKCGVPWLRIIKEKESSNIGENFRFSKAIIKDRLPYVKSICVVTKPPAERRVWAAFQEQMSEFTGYVTSPDFSFNWYVSNFYNAQQGLDEMINLLVSDVYKLKTYAKPGFQVPVEVPESIWLVCQELRKSGYNKYL